MAGDAAAIGSLTRGQPRAVAWVRRHTFEIVLVLPLVAYITVLTIAPILDTFRLSFSAPKTGFGTLHSCLGASRLPLSRRNRAHRRCTRTARRTDARS